MNKTSGFTLLELTISMAVFSLIAVAAVWLVFLSLNLRDLSSSNIKTEDSVRIFNQTFRQASQKAGTVTGGGNSLQLKATAECWSFLYDQVQKNIKYDHNTTLGCVPNPNPANSFFPTTIKVNSFSFSITPLVTGGRQVSATGSITTALPLSSYSQAFSATVTNLIDQ